MLVGKIIVEDGLLSRVRFLRGAAENDWLMSGTVLLASAARGRLTEVATIGRLTETVEIEVSANWFPEDPAAIGRFEDPAAIGRLTEVATIGRLTETVEIEVSANGFPEDPAAIGRLKDPAAIGRLEIVATIGRLTETVERFEIST